MFDAVESPYLVPFDGSFERKQARTKPPKGTPDKDRLEKRLKRVRRRLRDLQDVLYAENSWSVLLVFQAMDAAGKDGTIRAALQGVNPAGCQVFSFKQPSKEELDHDFLWRTAKSLPERGRIGVFNRSYYEEVLVVRVHPEYLDGQHLPDKVDPKRLWKQRYGSIRDHEEHLARNGTVVLKFWLNVSKDEQRERFLARLDEPHKNWKFSESDVKERKHWPAYMGAYEDVLNATSRSWAPWYAVPADDKPYMRVVVAETIVESLEKLKLSYPEVSDEAKERFDGMRALLDAE